jgi:hypothetical protein
MKQQQVPEVDGIDLDFTPTSYFRERDLHLTLPSDILGKARRDIARRLEAEGEDVPPEFLAGVLSDDDRTAIGRIHPMFMGGEYLPPLRRGEVEIARISLESVTADQISVRARRIGGRISYSIVDEYGDDGCINYAPHPRTSRAPLSMRQLVAMLDGACEHGGAVMSHTVWHVENVGPPEEYRHFVSVESDFYPDLGSYYEGRFDLYLESVAQKEEDAEQEEGL